MDKGICSLFQKSGFDKYSLTIFLLEQLFGIRRKTVFLSPGHNFFPGCFQFGAMKNEKMAVFPSMVVPKGNETRKKGSFSVNG